MESENIICAQNELKKVKNLFSEFLRVVNDINCLNELNSSDSNSKIDFGANHADCSEKGNDLNVPYDSYANTIPESHRTVWCGSAASAKENAFSNLPNDSYANATPESHGTIWSGSLASAKDNAFSNLPYDSYADTIPESNRTIWSGSAASAKENAFSNLPYNSYADTIPGSHGSIWSGSGAGAKEYAFSNLPNDSYANTIPEYNRTIWSGSAASAKENVFSNLPYNSYADTIPGSHGSIWSGLGASAKENAFSNLPNDSYANTIPESNRTIWSGSVASAKENAFSDLPYDSYADTIPESHGTIWSGSAASAKQNTYSNVTEVLKPNIKRTVSQMIDMDLPNYHGFIETRLQQILNEGIQTSGHSFDVEIADLTGQIIPQNHTFQMESEFASKDDGDMALTFANQIGVPLFIADFLRVSGDRKTLECNLDLSHSEIEVELTDCATFEIEHHQGCDVSNMFVPTSDSGVKKLCCVYCLKRYQNLERHLRTVHKNEAEVKNFLAFRPRTKTRRNIITRIRTRGQFEWNHNPQINGGEWSTSRRQKKKYQKKPWQLKHCPNCKGSFILLHQHWKKCTRNSIKGERVVSELSRLLDRRLHAEASEDLHTTFASIRDNAAIRMVRFDWLVVAYGNDLCLNYSPHYQKIYIRSKLRASAQLLQTSKSISSNISDLSSLFHVTNCNTVIEAIRIMGKFDLQTKLFESPGTASTTVTLINTIGELLVTEAMSVDDEEMERNTERFLKLFKKKAKTQILKSVSNSKAKARRGKKQNIPMTADVNKLKAYLESERTRCSSELSQKYTYRKWVALSQLTLASILVFNRRRAGEMQNITITDFNCREIIVDLHDTVLATIPDETKQEISSRMEIRGKLARTVPALLKHSFEQCIQLLIRHRKDAGIPDTNDFLFALPTQTSRIRTVNVWTIMRSFATACGAENPSSLTGTNLRKHFASFCATKNLNDNDVSNLADFMGHHEKVHRDVYRQNPLAWQVSLMSSLLNGAQEENSKHTNDSETVNAKTTPGYSSAFSLFLQSCINEPANVTTKTGATRIKTKKKVTSKIVSIKRKNSVAPKVIKKKVLNKNSCMKGKSSIASKVIKKRKVN